MYKPKDIARFWSKVDKEKSTIFYNGSRCWEWTGGGNPDGYGRAWMGSNMQNRLHQVHRVSYTLAFECIPDDLRVLHHCDNRACVNPAHLFLGTNQDNATDKVSKGRQQRLFGEANGAHKLSAVQVSEIRRRYKPLGIGGDTQVKLAKEFGITQAQVSAIVIGKVWK
jgi:hypothetical protein